jgi:hypothetical protein
LAKSAAAALPAGSTPEKTKNDAANIIAAADSLVIILWVPYENYATLMASAAPFLTKVRQAISGARYHFRTANGTS